MPEVTLVDAINLALARALADDPNVVVFGEDVGVNGGVFRPTAGLQQRFGVERVSWRWRSKEYAALTVPSAFPTGWALCLSGPVSASFSSSEPARQAAGPQHLTPLGR
jgi:hypothetical protein